MDPMKYTMEELINALVDQTMGEVTFSTDEYQFGEPEGTPNPGAMNLAEELYRSLRGIRPGTERAREVVSYFTDEIDHYSHYPSSHRLLDAIEHVVWNKYKDDPKPIVKIVTDAMDSNAAMDWYESERKYR